MRGRGDSLGWVSVGVARRLAPPTAGFLQAVGLGEALPEPRRLWFDGIGLWKFTQWGERGTDLKCH